MSASAQTRTGAPGAAIRGIAAELARTGIFFLLLSIAIIGSIGTAADPWRSALASGALMQIFGLASLLIAKLPSSRLLLCLPQTRAQAETAIWAIAFAIPVLFYALVYGGATAWSAWHGRAIWPGILMLLECAGLQGIVLLAWSFTPDTAGRIGWPGYTRRAARLLNAAIAIAGITLFLGTRLLPREYLPGALALAFMAGFPAALLVCLRRDILLKLHAATATGAAGAPVTARGWKAYLLVLLPMILLTLAGAMLLPALLVFADKDLYTISPVLLGEPFLPSFLIPATLLRGLRTMRLLPVSASAIAGLLIAAMAAGPGTACLFLAIVGGMAPAVYAASATFVTWILPATALGLPSLPFAVRFGRLWMVGAFYGVMMGAYTAGLVFFTHGTFAQPPLPLGTDLLACAALAAASFVWLRREVSAARGFGRAKDLLF